MRLVANRLGGINDDAVDSSPGTPGDKIEPGGDSIELCFEGDVAQLGERLVCNQKVTGSIPVISRNMAIKPSGFR